MRVGIEYGIHQGAEITEVARSIAIEVALSRVHNLRTVVVGIGNQVAIVIGITCVAFPITVGVKLIRVGNGRAVVWHVIGDPIVVSVCPAGRRAAITRHGVAVITLLAGVLDIIPVDFTCFNQ